jgi:ADP-L-glycero-D-manno-heptose 6-epimerase
VAKYLVTGAKGFIGTRLVHALQRRGDSVQTYDWDLGDATSPDISFMDDSVVDGVFHVGANSSTLEQDVQLIMVSNYEFTKNLAIACEAKGIPLVYSSSAACYGTDGRRPSNLYAWSKLIGEDAVLNHGGTSLRYFNVYGPGECHKGKMASFMHQAFVSHRHNLEVQLFPGFPKRDFIHVDDVCAANLIAMDLISDVSGRIFDVGTGETKSFENCLDAISVGWTYATEDQIPRGYQFLTKANPERYLPGWDPINFDERVKSYLNYMQGNCSHETSF